MRQRSFGAHLALIRQLTETKEMDLQSVAPTLVVNFRNRLVTNGNRDLKSCAGRGL
jgi:hypothetical protein